MTLTFGTGIVVGICITNIIIAFITFLGNRNCGGVPNIPHPIPMPPLPRKRPPAPPAPPDPPARKVTIRIQGNPNEGLLR